MKKREILLIIILAIILTVILFYLFVNKMEQGKTSECQTDEDCTKTQVSCCPCTMGGEERCASRKNATLIQEHLKGCSDKILCAAVYNCKEIKCSCEGGKCQES